MRYRPEIDGLRALAVVPVIFFHAGIEFFRGGYVGVDIFFVISGYLISRIIFSEMEAGGFSLVNFYERRARRIVPALFCVVCVSVPAAYIFLMPNQLNDFAESLIAVSTFSSNILFWIESGYFDSANELKPLLHTWSLALEEQFYILFPIFLMVLWRFGRVRLVGSLLLVLLLSLGLAQWGAYHKPAATFYLLPTRVWEILIGTFAALSIEKLNYSKIKMWICQLFSLAGVGLILFSVFFFDHQTPFPSFYALCPTIGAFLIIVYSVKGTFVQSLLSQKALVKVGLISYSAYLWHQPLFVFYRRSIFVKPTLFEMGILIICTFVLAYFSWRFVEVPFREKSRFSKRFVLAGSASAAILTIVIGLAGTITKGFQNRIPQHIAINAAPVSLSLVDANGDQCFDRKDNFCKFANDPSAEPLFILGDSHAASLAPNLVERLKGRFNITVLTNGECWPFANVEKYIHSGGVDSNCSDEVQRRRLNEILTAPRAGVVVIAGRLPVYLSDGMFFDNGEGGVEEDTFRVMKPLDHKSLSEHAVDYIREIRNFGHRVVVVYPYPEVGFDVFDRIARLYLSGKWDKDVILSTAHKRYQERNRDSFSLLDSIEGPRIFRVFPDKLLCDTEMVGRCVINRGDNIYYQDDDHPSILGAEMVNELIVSEIEKSGLRVEP